MANKTFTTPTGVANYPYISKPDTQFDAEGVYKVTLAVPEEEAKPIIDLINKELIAGIKALKEAKAVETAKKKLEREQKKQAKLDKQMEQDAMIELQAKMKLQAEQDASWSEERLTKLMEKTLDNYIAKKKKEKAPTTRQQIVPPQPNSQYVQYHQQPPQSYQQQAPQQTYRVPANNNINYADNPFGRFMS